MYANKAPSYQWYPDKWLADTRRLSWKAKGLYKDLLDIIWMQYQEVCSIPDNPDFIASELGCTVQEWTDARSEIMLEHRPLMQLITNRLFSNGLWKEHIKQQVRRERLAENGRKGGRPKKPKVPRKKAEKRLSSPTPSPTPSLSDKELSDKSDAFDVFWKSYPKKTGKGAARKAFEKGKCSDRMPVILRAIEQQRRSEQWRKERGQFIPNPVTWLNQERWEDEFSVNIAKPITPQNDRQQQQDKAKWEIVNAIRRAKAAALKPSDIQDAINALSDKYRDQPGVIKEALAITRNEPSPPLAKVLPAV